MTKSDGIHFIWQLWQEYEETKDSELLAQAIEAADFSDDFTENKDIQKAAAAFIRQHTRNHKYQTRVRNYTIRVMHKVNKSQGLSKEQSYRSIEETFDRWARETDKDDFVHTLVSTEAIRKILK